VTSNPSPRYVKAAVDAFRSGTYNGRTYSGKYGDLRATFAAILLDREARSGWDSSLLSYVGFFFLMIRPPSILDLDPTHGKLREPIVKVPTT
jgi:hypothetical protein